MMNEHEDSPDTLFLKAIVLISKWCLFLGLLLLSITGLLFLSGCSTWTAKTTDKELVYYFHESQVHRVKEGPGSDGFGR